VRLPVKQMRRSVFDVKQGGRERGREGDLEVLQEIGVDAQLQAGGPHAADARDVRLGGPVTCGPSVVNADGTRYESNNVGIRGTLLNVAFRHEGSGTLSCVGEVHGKPVGFFRRINPTVKPLTSDPRSCR